MNATAGNWELVNTVNGRTWTQRQIGWYTLDMPTEYRKYSERPQDDCNVTVPAGRYPIYACRDCGNPWHSLSIPMEGYHYSPYPHQIAKSILEGSILVELLDGVEVREVHFEWNGEPRVTHSIFIDGDKC